MVTCKRVGATETVLKQIRRESTMGNKTCLNFLKNYKKMDITIIKALYTVLDAGKQQYWKEIESKAKRQLEENWEMWCLRAAQATILNKNALEVLEQVKDHDNAMIVLDPPYVKELLGDYCKNLYQIEFTDEEQVRMLQIIQNAKANILVCGYRGGNLLYDQYLNKEHGWHCYLIHDRLNKACKTGDVKGFAKEYVWCNYDIPKAASRKMDIRDLVLSQAEVEYFINKRNA